ncbi:MAG: adenylate/guanylate cyclase domain-containing protein [Candidatus Riflebacteria bacterium]|nr:adenylate/guanylate cyclase domain-containing protein [Candidatus Riflebacteria bacterium]
MTFNLEQLQQLRDLHLNLDNLIEKQQLCHCNLESALEQTHLFLQKKIKTEVLYVETQDEQLNHRVYCLGKGDEGIKHKTPQLLKIDRPSSFCAHGMLWFVQPIEMANTATGTIGIAFANENSPDKVLGAAILDCISELLDNFFFSIHTSSLKHSLIMGIQSALKSHSIIDSIDGAVYVLKKAIPFKKLFIIYSDHELTGRENINYLVYENEVRINDSVNMPHSGLDEFIKNAGNDLKADDKMLHKAIGNDNITITYLLDGLIDENLIGKVIFVPEEKKSFSIFAREIVQVFAETLRQRLVDFNRERNMLRKFFSDQVIARLIAEPGYEELYLSPRESEIGIIFADISGFTKMSEQILKTPKRITEMVNKWSNDIVSRVFPLGACLDKIVGDCLIFLFGPPFYDTDPEALLDKTLQAARIIVDHTRDFLMLPENTDIQQHPDFEKFGVAIGVNYCPAVVGLIGPNDDLTAFSSGMNITARLQGLAKADQILVTERVMQIAGKSKKWQFTGPESAPVKNVKEPLVYYQLNLKTE